MLILLLLLGSVRHLLLKVCEMSLLNVSVNEMILPENLKGLLSISPLFHLMELLKKHRRSCREIENSPWQAAQ